MKNKKCRNILFLLTLVIAFCTVFVSCREEPQYMDYIPTYGDKSKELSGAYDFLSDEEKARIKKLHITNETDVYNICDFGAVSGEDCTQAIKTGIETVQKNGGGILYFPAGKYNVSEVITFSATESAPLILMGEPSGSFLSEIILTSTIESDAIVIASSNVSFAHLIFKSNMKTSAAVSISGEKTTLFNCKFECTANSKTSDALLKVCGSDALLTSLSFMLSGDNRYTINFTKLPEVVSKNNKLIDTYIGGKVNGILIDSQDSTGCPEDIWLSRVTLLNYSNGQVDIKSVKNCTISNSMLDQGFLFCVRLDPQGIGIDNVTISENYIAAAYNYGDKSYEKCGICIPESDTSAPVNNVTISENLIVFSQYGILVQNPNAKGLFIYGNSISCDYSLYMRTSTDNAIVSNRFGEEFYIGAFSGENIIQSNIINKLSIDCSFDDFKMENIVTVKEVEQ